MKEAEELAVKEVEAKAEAEVTAVTTRKGVPYSILIPSLVLLSNPLPTTSMIQILAKETP